MRLKMMVEWSLGSPERYDWDGVRLVPRDPPWPVEWGLPPVNYGMLPGYLNPADGCELDAVWAATEPIPAGTWLEGEVLGMIWVADLDHKIVLGLPGDLGRLDWDGLGTWFAGRDARMVGAEEAIAFVCSLSGEG